MIHLLEPVMAMVREAGAMLAREFLRPEGPRGLDGKAPIDAEIEAFLRARLTALLPTRFVGEELGAEGTVQGGLCWVVDPQDGTRDFLKGNRGSAVSVALLAAGRPVLGVVHAPLPPDRGADLIAWADGMDHLLRDDRPVVRRLDGAGLTPGSLVFLGESARLRPEGYGKAVAPARFVALPSIAYRLARVAAGDGVASASWNALSAYDIAAGHALVAAAGGVVVNERSDPIRYAADGTGAIGACFAGGAAAALALAAQRRTLDPRRTPRVLLRWPRSAAGTDRAIGCLLGQVIGDSLGSLVEFNEPKKIRARYPNGVRDLADGGTWNTLAGQPTDDSELALALARTIVAAGGYQEEATAAAYARWYQSGPFNIGRTTRAALSAAAEAADGSRAAACRAAASRESQSNGALMRASPIGIFAPDAARAAAAAARDCALTHPHPVCIAASVAFVVAIAAGIAGAEPPAMWASAEAAATGLEGGLPVRERLAAAARGDVPADFVTQQGWVLIALQNAFFRLLHAPDPQAALIETVGAGGDTDTNAAIAGALIGAASGRAAFPARWVLPVLACRPLAALGAPRPRPEEYWPDDVPALAEALRAAGQEQQNHGLALPA